MTATSRRTALGARAPEGVVVVVGSALAVVAVAWALREGEGRSALARADEAAAKAEVHEVVVSLRAAAEARCPTCRSPDLAFARLDAVAKDAEARGDLATARFALGAVRTAELATTLGRSERRTRAERELVRLARSPSEPAQADHVAESLARDELPRPTTFALLAAALGLLVAAAFRVLREGRLHAWEAVLAAAGFAVGALGLLAF